MKKTEFIEEMKDYAKKYGTVSVEEINRTSSTYTGMVIKKVNIPSPVVNLDLLYDKYTDGYFDLDDCFMEVDRIMSLKSPFEPSMITKWDNAKGRLYLRLFGEITPGTLYRKVADMFLVPYVQIDEIPGATVKVVAPLLNTWGITEDELFELAKINQEKIRPAKIDNLADMIGAPEEAPIYVISTETGVCGASAILYSGVADEVKERIGEDFYILPSSIHEVIAIPKSLGSSVEDLANFVACVNQTDVDEDERLTESVYTFDENGEFVKVSE